MQDLFVIACMVLLGLTLITGLALLIGHQRQQRKRFLGYVAGMGWRIDVDTTEELPAVLRDSAIELLRREGRGFRVRDVITGKHEGCLLYTSDAADD